MTRLRALVAATAVFVPVGLGLGAAPALADEGTSYVALGDSYAAAPLVPVQSGTPAGCLRSTQNYPSQVAKQLGFSTVRDVSCSGAVTDDMTAPQKTDNGTNPAQFDALSPDTDVVTLTIGGNDVGFTSIITTCIKKSGLHPLGSACKDFYTAGGTDQLAEKIDATGSKIGAVLRGIHDRAPDAKVAVSGYLSILPDSGPGCYPVIPFSSGDVAYLRGVEQRLNGMIQDETEKAGDVYVDTYTPSIGHDACQLPGTKWVEGIIPTAPAAPVHPNALGTAAQAAAVVAALKSSSSAA